jgi:heat shock protein HslJ
MIRKKVPFFVVLGLIILVAACTPQGPGVPVTGETDTPQSPGATPLPPQAVLDAQQWLAQQLSVAVEQVQLVEIDQEEWPDSCLGLGRPEESCAAVITPGWRVVVEVNGQTYEIRTDETASVIRLASPEQSPVPESGMENTHWTLVSFGPRGAEEPLVEGSAITMMLAGGQAGGSGGCNSYGGMYQVEGDRISFEEITSTLRACEDMRITEQEQRFFQALETASQYEVTGDELRITYDNGNGLLIFTRAQ